MRRSPASTPASTQVIPVASRRWRSRLHRPETWAEIGRFRAALRARHYDAVVDTQGLMRTALIAKGARGVTPRLRHREHPRAARLVPL